MAPIRCTGCAAYSSDRSRAAGALVEIDYIHRRAEFQIIIVPSYQGRGYAKAAIRIAVGYAFRVLNLHNVYLVVDKDNRAAVHIYERCGFQIEGLLKEAFFSNGTYRDAYRIALRRTTICAASVPAHRGCATGRRKRGRADGRRDAAPPAVAAIKAVFAFGWRRIAEPPMKTLAVFSSPPAVAASHWPPPAGWRRRRRTPPSTAWRCRSSPGPGTKP